MKCLLITTYSIAIRPLTGPIAQNLDYGKRQIGAQTSGSRTKSKSANFDRAWQQLEGRSWHAGRAGWIYPLPSAAGQPSLLSGQPRYPGANIALGSGTISFDVLSWLGEQGVALARISWTGEVACVASGSGYASDQSKVQWQHRMRADEAARIEFASDLIRGKLLSSIETLKDFIPASARRTATIERHQRGADRLGSERFMEMNDIRAIEGQCASMYFTAWQSLEVRWKGAKAIPDDWRTFVCRSSLANGVKPYNREASHPVNAMLNYAYAVKLAHMQIAAIAEGYDPTIGIMHHARRGKPAFIFDRIEPERPSVDAAILGLVKRHTFSAADFMLRKDGVCRLSPQLARMVATLMRE